MRDGAGGRDAQLRSCPGRRRRVPGQLCAASGDGDGRCRRANSARRSRWRESCPVQRGRNRATVRCSFSTATRLRPSMGARLGSSSRGADPAQGKGTAVAVVRTDEPPTGWDDVTALLRLRAADGGGLSPGQTGVVKFAPTVRAFRAIPASAVIRSPRGPFVFLVGQDHRTFTKRMIAIGGVVYDQASVLGSRRGRPDRNQAHVRVGRGASVFAAGAAVIARIVGWSARHSGIVLVTAAALAIASYAAQRSLARDVLPDLSDPQVVLVAEWMGHPALEVAAPGDRGHDRGAGGRARLEGDPRSIHDGNGLPRRCIWLTVNGGGGPDRDRLSN